jgi:hypothetical protein
VDESFCQREAYQQGHLTDTPDLALYDRMHARQLRLARARIPELWRMETFPFERQPKLDKKRILSLYDA